MEPDFKKLKTDLEAFETKWKEIVKENNVDRKAILVRALAYWNRDAYKTFYDMADKFDSSSLKKMEKEILNRSAKSTEQ